MRLVRARSLSVSALVHAAILAGIVLIPAFSLRRKPETRIYTVHVLREATLQKKKPSQPKAPVQKKPKVAEKPKEKPKVAEKPKEEPKEKEKEKPKPKKKLVTKNVLKEKEAVRKKIEEREKEMERKFVEPEEFLEQQRTATVETEDFDFPWYGDLLASKVYSSWVQPSKAMVGESPLQAVIAFRVFRDGHATILDIRSSSGKHLMDESASKAIEDAQPFPPFPAEWKGGSIDVTVTFDLAD